jgi:hypothetical protein
MLMQRKRFARLLAIFAFVAAALVGTALPASASTTATTTHVAAVSSTQLHQTRPDIPRSYWYIYGTFQSLGDCKAMGNALVDAGEVQNYSCQYDRGEYDLWVDAGF